MPNNILITPTSASIQFSGSGNTDTIRLQVEASGSVAFYGTSGSLFGIVDNLSGSLMSVNDVSGLPILEVFSDDRVVMGTLNRNALVVTGSRVGIGKANPATGLDVSGSVFITGSLGVTAGITGSLSGTSSYAANADLLDGLDSTVFATTGSNTFVGNQTISGSLSISSGSEVTVNGPFRSRLVINTQAADYTLAAADEGEMVLMTSGGLNVVTVPSSSTVNFSTGAQVMITQGGAGQTRITSASTGVTLRSANSALKIANQYSAATLIKTDTDTWYVFGDITV